MKKIATVLKLRKYYFLKILRKLGILPLLNFHVRYTPYQKSFTIPVIGGIGHYNLLSTESWLFRLFHKLHKLKDGTFIDVGINIGQTLLKIKSINPDMNYIGFEPNPNCIYYTQKLIKANHFTNTTIIPIGLSNKTGFETLFADTETSGTASMLKDFRIKYSITNTFQLPVFSLDAIESLNKNIGIIKIDVEGYELEVVAGMLTVLMDQRPYVFCEILPVYNTDTENGKYRYTRQQQLEQLLKQVNYSFSLIDEQNNVLHPFDVIPVHGDMQKTNYLFIRRKKPLK
jgi:FkbM family methyltransferase